MYNLSPRMGLPIRSETSELVGPNTYVLCSDAPIKESEAPFLSWTPRDSVLLQKLFTEAIYDVADSEKYAVKGGSSLRSKADRFVYKHDDLPSPTHYHPKKPGKSVKREIVSKGNFCRAAGSEGYSCPTIPTKNEVNGYDIVDDKPVKIPPNWHDDSLGPAYYNVMTGDLYKRRYGGCKWSAYRSQRSTYKVCDGPGPFEYSVELPRCSKSQADEEYRQMARLFTFIPRFTEAQELKTKCENLPGPGQYHPEITEDPVRSRSVHPRPFITAKERFVYSESDNPSPADYEADEGITTKRVGLSDAPFGVVCARYSKKKIIPTPGPATYEFKSPLVEKIKSKKSPYSLVDPPFNKTSKRDVDNARPDAKWTPAPSDYTLRKERVEKMPVDSHVFKSAVGRFKIDQRADKMGPARYNIREQSDKNKSRVSHNVGKVPFMTTGPRSTFARVKYITPGPGQYIRKSRIKQRGYYFKTTPRFEADPEPRPGPTSYTLHPSIERSVFRAFQSNNSHLKESIEMKNKNVKHPDTLGEYFNSLTAKKALRCFKSHFYMHCECPYETSRSPECM